MPGLQYQLGSFIWTVNIFFSDAQFLMLDMVLLEMLSFCLHKAEKLFLWKFITLYMHFSILEMPRIEIRHLETPESCTHEVMYLRTIWAMFQSQELQWRYF